MLSEKGDIRLEPAGARGRHRLSSARQPAAPSHTAPISRAFSSEVPDWCARSDHSHEYFALERFGLRRSVKNGLEVDSQCKADRERSNGVPRGGDEDNGSPGVVVASVAVGSASAGGGVGGGVHRSGLGSRSFQEPQQERPPEMMANAVAHQADAVTHGRGPCSRATWRDR